VNPVLSDRHESMGPSEGPVVLDIGEAFGAIVLRTTAELDRREIEIRPIAGSWEGTHVAVRARPSSGRPLHAAVFGRLAEGHYELRRRDRADGVVLSVTVTGGVVTECEWPVVVQEAPPTGYGESDGSRQESSSPETLLTTKEGALLC